MSLPIESERNASMYLPAPAPPAAAPTADGDGGLRRLARTALLTIGVIFGGLGGWACLADLESSTMAAGKVVVEAHRKTVSSLEGGVLATLLVSEGQRVEPGQPLLRFDSSQAEADYNQARIEYWSARAGLARLAAERADARTVTLPDDLAKTAATDPVLTGLIDSERKLFRARWESFDAIVDAQTKVIAQLRQQEVAVAAEQQALEEELRYTSEQLNDTAGLFAKGYQTKTNVLALKRAVADTQGQIRQRIATRAADDQMIAAAETEITKARAARLADIAKDLTDTENIAAGAAQKLAAAKSILGRRELVSPDRGIVTDIHFFTPGGGIPPGQPILDIVPLDTPLLVEAQVDPAAIERVRPGMKAHAQLLAYPTHLVPMIPGTVVYVGADRQTDDQGHAFFITRIALDTKTLDGLPRVRLSPGMPADVYITEEKRPAIDYFISPISHTFRRAFHEE